MQGTPDEIAWVAESRMLGLCELARSTFQSWINAGLDIEESNGAYGLGQVLAIAILVQARHYMGLDELVGAWRDVTARGAGTAMLNTARDLKKGKRFDLVIEPEHASIAVAQTNAQLVKAVRHPGAPRPVVVVDFAERIMLLNQSFDRMARLAPKPHEKRRGRPRNLIVTDARTHARLDRER